jgi:hypothetical protein
LHENSLALSIFINDVVVACNNLFCGEILMYADGILIIAKSVGALQFMFEIVQREIIKCNMVLNVANVVPCVSGIALTVSVNASPPTLGLIYHG